MSSETPKLPSTYTWDYTVKTYDTDCNCVLRPSVLLRLLQEVGEMHLQCTDLGYTQLNEMGLYFVLLQTNNVINRLPKLEEKIKVKTWHRDSKGVRFYRCYQILDTDDNVLAESVGVFVLVDLETHKVLRPNVFYDLGVSAQPDMLGGCPDPTPIKVNLDDTDFCDKRKFHWSDTDWNKHTNNTIYADIMCDALSDLMIDETKKLSAFSIAYIKETCIGDEIDIQKVVTLSDNTENALVAGVFADKTLCFEASLRFDCVD